jgi:hypothetical protein
MGSTPLLAAVDPANFDRLLCCDIKCATNPGRQQKLCWMQVNACFGLQGKILVAGDATRVGLRGVAVMAREGPWMAGRGLFVANGSEAADAAPPDYELLVRKFRKNAGSPRFPRDWDRRGRIWDSGASRQSRVVAGGAGRADGRLLADHQISRTRFRNIMNRLPTTS